MNFLTRPIALFLFLGFTATVLAAPVCSLTKTDDETGKTSEFDVPLARTTSTDRFYELTLDGVKFRAVAPVHDDASIHFVAWFADRQTASADGVRGLTVFSVTNQTKDGLAEYELRCRP